MKPLLGKFEKYPSPLHANRTIDHYNTGACTNDQNYTHYCRFGLSATGKKKEAYGCMKVGRGVIVKFIRGMHQGEEDIRGICNGVQHGAYGCYDVMVSIMLLSP